MSSGLEPTKFNPTDIHENCMEIFEKKQWVTFFENFDGHNEHVSLDFSKTFDGEGVIVGSCTSDWMNTFWYKLLSCHRKDKDFSKLSNLRRRHGYPFCADREQGQ